MSSDIDSFGEVGDHDERTIKVGGLVDPRRNIYVQRMSNDIPNITLEEQLRDQLLSGQDTMVVGSRHVGKSSLVNYVSLEMATKHGFQTAWADLDLGISAYADQEERFVDLLCQDVGVALPEPPKLLDAVRHILTTTGKRLLVVVDELDSIEDKGIGGAFLVRSIRAVQQHRDRTDEFQGRLVFCFLSVHGVGRMFDNADLFGRAEAATEIMCKTIDIGLFRASEQTTRDIAACFRKHDPQSAVNLARAVLEDSGGYPQLCMALARRLVETNQRYTVRDLQQWFNKQALWFRDEASSFDRAFLDVSDAIIRSFPDAEALIALELYLRVLASELELAFGPTTDNAVGWDRGLKGLAVLRLAGLVRRDDAGRVRSIGGFMDRYFDKKWAEGVHAELAAHKATYVARAPRPLASDRPKICVFLTGGTIGMVERDGRVVPPTDARELQQEYEHVDEQFDVTWRIYRPELLDSANVGPRHWKEFAATVHSELRRDVFGVVIAHGTDTLAFTASALAFALGTDLGKPVVLTGSQTTVDQLHGDARSNLVRACMVAATPGLPEVAIVFGEHVFRGVRAVKRDDRRFDAFESLLYPPLGMVSETVQLQPEVIRRSTGHPNPGVVPEFADGIAVISQVPGLLPAFYEAALDDPACRPRGLIIQTLGAGNIPTHDPYGLAGVIRKATRQRIPVLLASQYPVHPDNLGRYAPSRLAIDAGAIPVANMTVAATVAKFSWVLGQMGDDVDLEAVRAQMLFNYVGELDRHDAEELMKRRPS